MEENTLSSANAGSPYFIDTAAMIANTDAVGDASVMTTVDGNWKGDMEATNVHSVAGFVHAYAHLGNGLIIYNGFDTDNIASTNNGVARI